MKINKNSISLASLLLLTACQQSDITEVKSQVEKEKKLAVSFLPDALELKVHEDVSYAGSGLKSPFRHTISEVKTAKKTLTEIQPDLERKKGELEGFPLTNFQMLGTIKSEKDDSLQAIVNNGKGKVFIISKGDYIGKNEGKILDIKDGVIELEEIIANGNYRWVKRPATISILGR